LIGESTIQMPFGPSSFLTGGATVSEWRDTILLGDCRPLSADIPDDSVDMIFTDPPYLEDCIGLYGDLADIAARVLKPGALVLAYCGAMFLDDVFALFRERSPRLKWFWEFRVHHNGGFARMFKTHTIQAGKPILAWFKPNAEGKASPHNWKWIVDECRGGSKSKKHHKWGQSAEEAAYFIEAYTLPGDFVLDPFMGGGTTIEAARNLGREATGYEIDAKYFGVAQDRLAQGNLFATAIAGVAASELFAPKGEETP